MENQQAGGYGYGSNKFVSDTDKSLQSSAGGAFGLNQKVRLVKFAYSPNVAKEGEPAREALEIAVQVGEKEFRDRVYPITRVYGKNNVEISDPNHAEFPALFEKEKNQQIGLLTHYLKSMVVTEDAIKNVVEGATSFASLMQGLQNLLPADYASRPMDVFLQYQWNIGDGQDRTFLELPGNMKGGYFLVPHAPGNWTETRVEGALTYVNEQGQEHPFTRSKDFMESRKGVQQLKGQPAPGAPVGQQVAMGQGSNAPAGNGGAQATTWNIPQ